MESILTSIKKLLGIDEEYEHFDSDIIMHINSALMTLTQLGIGPAEGYSILSKLETWQNFLGDTASLEAVKQYIFIDVKLAFDTSTTSNATLEALNRKKEELVWRLLIQRESMKDEEE